MDQAATYEESFTSKGLGVFGAVAVHTAIIAWFAASPAQNIISADLYSPPTNITISFTKALEKQVIPQKPVEKKVAKKAIKPLPVENIAENFNKVEPAAFTPPQEVVSKIEPKPLPQSIPVVKEVNLKGSRVYPQYPKRALRLKQEGTVWLRVLVSTDGEQETLQLHRPSQYAQLNQAAIKAVKKWKFQPTQRGGVPIKSWVEIPIEFAIQ